jgi:CIC family chloride channel protein
MGLERARLLRLITLFWLVNAIGIGVAAGIWLYGQEIQCISGLRLQLSQSLPRELVLPLMGLGAGALSGALISGIEPAASGSGIVQVLLYRRGAAVPMGWRVALVKLLASGIAIGGGLPVGPEGPSIQIGASVARETARGLGYRGRALLPVVIGSGAGLAAIFHAPLGGLAYILEEMLGRLDARVNAMAAFATFMAVAWTRLLVDGGQGPLLWRSLSPVIEYPSGNTSLRLLDLPILLSLGLVAGLLAPLYQAAIAHLRQRLVRRRLPAWQILPLVGLVIGLAYSLLPARFDNQEHLALEALSGMTDGPQALLVLAVQASGTAIAVAADAPGGFLAPALVVGASLGSLLQQLSLQLFDYAPATLLFAGGAAFLGALTRTPLTAILLSFELSKDYGLLLPIGFCVLTAIAVADQFQRHTLFEEMVADAERVAAERTPNP